MKLPQRYFSLGSNWIYYKFYLGYQVTDDFLITTLQPIIRFLFEEKIIDKWFFINYKDTDRHIRVRFHIPDVNQNLTYLVQAINKNVHYLIEDKILHKIQVDTYKRELERYGKFTIEEAESIFFYNSELILAIIEKTTHDDQARWLWGLKALDSFLNSWEYTLVQKRDFFEKLKIAFGNEMNATNSIKRQLAKKYRIEKGNIYSIVQTSDENLLYHINTYLTAIKPHVDSIKHKKENNILQMQLSDLLESFVHMHCNRLFKANHRKSEWVLYDFLYHFYRSEVEKNKFRVNN